MRHPSMSTRGTNVALVFAFAIAFFLPKRVECSFPGQSCGHAGKYRSYCTDYEIEPLGFYAIELVAHRDIGFAYSSESDCR